MKPNGKGLTPEKKKKLKEMMGSYSGPVDLNKLLEIKRKWFTNTDK